MKIVQATNDNLTELMSFYSVMCDVLGEKSFLPNGDKGGFPSQAMVEESIKDRCQFIGIEDNKIVAAYILNHDCDSAYNTVHWQIIHLLLQLIDSYSNWHITNLAGNAF